MPIYRLQDQKALINLAEKRGWLESPSDLSVVKVVVPQVLFSDTSQVKKYLPETELECQKSVRICLPEAIVHGRNFSLIVGNDIFPGGLTHSFAPSPGWVSVDSQHVEYVPKFDAERAIDDAELLGLVCHWGHFFVDALDRLLMLENYGAIPPRLLVGDPNLFNLNPQVDECFSVHQVSELIRVLGIDWEPSKLLPVPKCEDLLVTNLHMWTLHSTKPSISSSSFLEVRSRAGVAGRREPGAKADLLFVGRSDVRKRLVRNQDALVAELENVHGAKAIFPEFITVKEAIACFSEASRVILPVGSAKFNLTFCRPGTLVICVNPKGYSELNGGVTLMVRHMCHALGLQLCFYEVDIEPAKILLNSNLVFSQRDAQAMIDMFDIMAAA